MADNTLGFQVKEKIASLEIALKQVLPNMPTLLREIHTHLRNDRDCVTLCTEEEIATVVNGLKRQTATEIVLATAKKSKKTTAVVDADEL